MQLSERLTKIASMVTAGNCLADVGTDHGYVPIYLLENKKIPRAIAMDINEGPLERARLHIAESGLEQMVETRLSDGMAALKPGEADTVVIAGMGGPLMIRILSDDPEVTGSLKELILQPQSEIAQVRKWLYEKRYEITEEHMVFEEGKYYPMFRAEKNSQCKEPTVLEYQFGCLDVQREPEVLRAFLEKEIRGKKEILEKLLENPTQKSRERAVEMNRILKDYKTVLSQLLERFEK